MYYLDVIRIVLFILSTLIFIVYLIIPRKGKINKGLVILIMLLSLIISDIVTPRKPEELLITKTIEKFSPNRKYKIIISRVGESGVFSGYAYYIISIGRKKGEDYGMREYFRYKVHSIKDQECFDFEWFEDGVKIVFFKTRRGDVVYKIYWDDVFWNSAFKYYNETVNDKFIFTWKLHNFLNFLLSVDDYIKVNLAMSFTMFYLKSVKANTDDRLMKKIYYI